MTMIFQIISCILVVVAIAAALYGAVKKSCTEGAWGFALIFLVFAAVFAGISTTAHAAEPPTAALKYRSDVIRSARVDWGLNAPVADFAAQLHQESGWDPAARSPVGAQGLAQFMPSTAEWIARLMPHLAAREPYNPGWAIRALVSYDRWLWQRVAVPGGCERMAMTLSAYNGGLGWVNRDRRLARMRGLDDARWFDSVETVNAGRSAANWRENRHYPQRILHTLAPRYLSWGGASCVG